VAAEEARHHATYLACFHPGHGGNRCDLARGSRRRFGAPCPGHGPAGDCAYQGEGHDPGRQKAVSGRRRPADQIYVANFGSGTVSVISARTDTVVK